MTDCPGTPSEAKCMRRAIAAVVFPDPAGPSRNIRPSNGISASCACLSVRASIGWNCKLRTAGSCPYNRRSICISRHSLSTTLKWHAGLRVFKRADWNGDWLIQVPLRNEFAKTRNAGCAIRQIVPVRVIRCGAREPHLTREIRRQPPPRCSWPRASSTGRPPRVSFIQRMLPGGRAD